MPIFQHCETPAGVLKVRVADRFITRALGLLVGPPLEAAEGLLIAPCSSIHTIGMRYPIDVVFLDREARVLRVFAQVRAGRMRLALGAHAVLELRSGIAAQHGLAPGVRLPELARAGSLIDERELSRESAESGPDQLHSVGRRRRQ